MFICIYIFACFFFAQPLSAVQKEILFACVIAVNNAANYKKFV